jgi:hypothetical protein
VLAFPGIAMWLPEALTEQPAGEDVWPEDFPQDLARATAAPASTPAFADAGAFRPY